MYRTEPNNCRTSYNCNVNYSEMNSIPANIKKSTEEIIIQLSLAGYDRSEVNVKLEENDLVISTLPNQDPQKYVRKEFVKSNLKRVFRLPSTVLKDEIAAKFENGILTLTLKKENKSQSSINIL